MRLLNISLGIIQFWKQSTVYTVKNARNKNLKKKYRRKLMQWVQHWGLFKKEKDKWRNICREARLKSRNTGGRTIKLEDPTHSIVTKYCRCCWFTSQQQCLQWYWRRTGNFGLELPWLKICWIQSSFCVYSNWCLW